jgi:hypothetical protein
VLEVDIMTSTLVFQNKEIPVYSSEQNKKAMRKLEFILNQKWETGKQAIKQCLATLISIEIIGSEATLHALTEHHSLTISLY